LRAAVALQAGFSFLPRQGLSLDTPPSTLDTRAGSMKAERREKSGNTAPTPSANAKAPRNPWWMHAALLVVLLLVNLSLYHGTLNLGYVSVDDPDYIQNNAYIENFHAANLKRVLTAPYFANYAPANLLSYSLDVALAGRKSDFVFHLSNVLWHGLTVCAVYLLALAIRAEICLAATAALLFMLHPAHVEVVAWISSRKDLVATTFAVLAMTCYLLYRRRSRGHRWWYGGSVRCFLLASAAKQSVVLLPAAMLAWDALVEKRRNWQMLADKVPFALVAVFFGWMTWNAQPSTNQPREIFGLAGTEFTDLWLLTGFGQYVLYRPAPDPTGWSQGARVAIIIAAAVVWALPLLLLRTRPPVRTALCYWVLIQLVPPMVLNFIVPITDRYLFLPSVGACLLLADVASGLAGRFPRGRWAWWGIVLCFAVLWGSKTWGYIAEWRDPRSVWYGAHLKTKTPQVLQFLGEVYHNAGDRVDNFVKSGAGPQATNELKFAQAVLGDAAKVERLRAEWLTAPPVRTNSIAYREELWRLAWAQYEEAVARRGRVSAPNLFMNRARLLVSEGKFEQAIPEFQKALAFAQTSTYNVVRQETSTHALFAIGVAHWHLRQYREAQQWLLKAQEAQRKSGQTWIPALDREVERVKALAGQQQ